MIPMAKLREVRQRLLLSQVDLAKRSGIAASTINRLEVKGQLARYVTVRKLAEALGVKPEELVGNIKADNSARAP
jgi:transcriptional regulator with XRE-family HTH domain